MKHSLIEYESDFLEKGYRAICSCGYTCKLAPSMPDANLLHADHIIEMECAQRSDSGKDKQ